MESLFDVTTENLELKIASLRSWKRVIRNKANSNSKDSSNSMPVPTKRLAGALILPQTLKLVINKKSNRLKKTIFNHLLPPLGLVLNPNSIHENS